MYYVLTVTEVFKLKQIMSIFFSAKYFIKILTVKNFKEYSKETLPVCISLNFQEKENTQ